MSKQTKDLKRVGGFANWGGAREGAGRPRKEPKEQLVIRVPVGSRDVLKFRAEILGYKTISSYIIDLINKDTSARLG